MIYICYISEEYFRINRRSKSKVAARITRSNPRKSKTILIIHTTPTVHTDPITDLFYLCSVIRAGLFSIVNHCWLHVNKTKINKFAKENIAVPAQTSHLKAISEVRLHFFH